MNSNSIITAIKKYEMLHENDTVVIGLSGGADSVCLTHFLCSLKSDMKLNLIAAHINHGIRGDEALRDESFCIELCDTLGIDIKVLKADIPMLSKKLKMSEEECGRKVRYDFFNSLCGENGKIATAHNLNDNAETVLLNIARGTGSKGLCGIPPIRDNIIRPLIETDRQAIEKYCDNNNLSFVTDSTNLETEYSRNKIRHLVLPVLEEINSSALQAFLRLTQSMSVDESYISGQAQDAYLKCVNDNKIDIDIFNSFDSALKSRVALKYLTDNGCSDISQKNIEDVISLFVANKQLTTADGLTLRSRNGFVEAVTGGRSTEWSQTVKKENGIINIPYGTAKIKIYTQKDLQILNKELLDNLIDCDKIVNTLLIRSRREGDSITLKKRNVTKTLKKLFNEEKISPESRNEIAVLSDGDAVVWVDGFGASKKYSVGNNTQLAMQITVLRGKDNG